MKIKVALEKFKVKTEKQEGKLRKQRDSWQSQLNRREKFWVTRDGTSNIIYNDNLRKNI